MRVLSVGNMYPPHHLGGYELMWRSAVAHLRERGHEVRVLTSDYRGEGMSAEPGGEEDVHRDLRWYWHDHAFSPIGLGARVKLERHNASVFERHLGEFRPDAVNWWAMGGMSLSLIEAARRRGLPAVGVVVDDWMVYGPEVDAWQRALRRLGPLRGAAERLSGVPGDLELDRAGRWLFVSETVRRHAREAGFAVPDSAVANAGVDRSAFASAPPRHWRGRLLLVGRLDRRKGAHVAIRMLEHVADASLEIVGDGDRAYLAELRSLVESAGLERRVSFSRRPRHELPAAYAAADALVFPVLWEEPWGLVPLEAMSVGLPVIASGTGGSGEYLRDGENCLLYAPPDDPRALARAVAAIASDHALRRRLREQGFATAERFPESAFNAAVAEAVERLAPGG